MYIKVYIYRYKTCGYIYLSKCISYMYICICICISTYSSWYLYMFTYLYIRTCEYCSPIVFHVESGFCDLVSGFCDSYGISFLNLQDSCICMYIYVCTKVCSNVEFKFISKNLSKFSSRYAHTSKYIP